MIRLGVFGATGAVGEEIIKLLVNRITDVSIRIFASASSAGRTMNFNGTSFKVEDANKVNFCDFDLAFFAISGAWSKRNAQTATDSGCIVIDNSSAFRYNPEIPLVIPQINSDSIGNSKLISNPNCTTAIAAIPLYNIHKEFKLKRIIISTYQAASGAGNKGIQELLNECNQHPKNNINQNQEISTDSKIFQHRLAFNLIPHIDAPQPNNYTREEMKVVWELRKIFNEPDLKISCTCVRVPILRVHSESISVETNFPVDLERIKKIFRSTSGIVLRDNISKNIYPMPLTASKVHNVEVGRIRKNLVFDNGLDFFVAGDQLLRGAALNAVEIAEYLITNRKITLNNWSDKC